MAFLEPIFTALKKFMETELDSQLAKSLSEDELELAIRPALNALRRSIAGEPEIAHIPVPEVDVPSLQVSFQPALRAIAVARENLELRELTDGILANLWRGAKNSFSNPVSAAADGVIPGLGSFFSGIGLSKADDAAKDVLFKAVNIFYNATEDEFWEVSGQLLASLKRFGLQFETETDRVRSTLQQIDELSETNDEDEKELARACEQAECLAEEFPDLLSVLLVKTRLLLLAERWLDGEQAAYEAHHLDPENEEAINLLLLARLRQENWPVVEQTLRFIVEAGPLSGAAAFIVGEALRQFPDFSEVSSLVDPVIRALEEDERVLSKLLSLRAMAVKLGFEGDATNDAGLLLETLREVPISSEDAARLRTDLKGNPEAVGTPLHGILIGTVDPYPVAEHFLGTLEKRVIAFREIPENKRENATQAFVRLKDGEQLVCYRDTTVFGGGKEGYALTDQRILWHDLWEAPNALSYRDIADVTLQGLDDGKPSGIQLKLQGQPPVADSLMLKISVPSEALLLSNCLATIVAAQDSQNSLCMGPL
jgi:hypothetical protein